MSQQMFNLSTAVPFTWALSLKGVAILGCFLLIGALSTQHWNQSDPGQNPAPRFQHYTCFLTPHPNSTSISYLPKKSNDTISCIWDHLQIPITTIKAKQAASRWCRHWPLAGNILYSEIQPGAKKSDSCSTIINHELSTVLGPRPQRCGKARDCRQSKGLPRPFGIQDVEDAGLTQSSRGGWRQT